MRRGLLLLGLFLVLGCRESQIEPAPGSATSTTVASLSRDKADALERVSMASRATMLRDAGFDPTRFAEYVSEIPVSRRADFFLLLESVPGVVIQAAKGSREEALLKAARLTQVEREAWEKEKRSR